MSRIWQIVLLSTTMGLSLACATSQSVEHSALSPLEAKGIEDTLKRVNLNADKPIWFTGALRLGPNLYERYAFADGPRVLLNIASEAPTWVHSMCYEHPETITQAANAGMKELSYHLLRHRYDDPESQLIEELGGSIHNFEHEDWMCHGVNFSKEVQLRDIIDSESARLSTVDYERFTAAREDAKQGLIRARNAHIEEMLSPSLDRLLYEHLFEVSDYAVPKLSRQVGLMKLSSEEALQVVADSYDGRARLHILLGINDREQALNLISERYGNANYEGGDPSLSPTKTSTKKAAQWSLQLLKAESAQAKLPPIKIKLKSKNSYLMFVWALPAQHHADFVPLQAAAHLLAQDLDLSSVIEMKIELRKYGSRFQILFRNNDALTPSEALSKIRERITAISSEPNLPQRIKALRSVIKTRFWAQMDPPIQRIESLARAGISGGNVESLARELNAIDKLTRNQLVRVLSEYFVLRTPLTAIGEAKKK